VAQIDQDIERGEEIQESKARCPGAKEEGDEEDREAGQKGKIEKTRSETCSGSGNSITAGTPAVCSVSANFRGHD